MFAAPSRFPCRKKSDNFILYSVEHRKYIGRLSPEQSLFPSMQRVCSCTPAVLKMLFLLFLLRPLFASCTELFPNWTQVRPLSQRLYSLSPFYLRSAPAMLKFLIATIFPFPLSFGWTGCSYPLFIMSFFFSGEGHPRFGSPAPLRRPSSGSAGRHQFIYRHIVSLCFPFLYHAI